MAVEGADRDSCHYHAVWDQAVQPQHGAPTVPPPLPLQSLVGVCAAFAQPDALKGSLVETLVEVRHGGS